MTLKSTIRRARPRLSIALLGLVGSACADDPVDPCEHRLCSIDDPACVERIAETMACQLDIAEVADPVVRFLSSDEVVAEIVAGRQDLTEQDIQDITDYYHGEALVGLMPETYQFGDQDTSYVDWAIAYYSSDPSEVVIITDNVGDDVERAYTVMVHEMVHVYQDQQRDFATLREEHATTYDRFLGLRAIIEGEAEHYESLAQIHLDGLRLDRIDWDGFFSGYQEWALEGAAESDAPSLDASAYFPYAFGSEFVFDAQARDQRAGIDALFTTPPDSVRQVMRGHQHWPDQARNSDARLDPQAAPVLPARYEFLGGGHQSVWLLNAMVQRTTGLTDLWALNALDRISADYLSIFRDEESGELVALWRIQANDTRSLTNALLQSPSNSLWTDVIDEPTQRLVLSVGDDVLLVATDGPDARSVVDAIEGWQDPAALFEDEDAAASTRVGPRWVANHRCPMR